MKCNRAWLLVTAVGLLFASVGSASADYASDLVAALTSGKVGVNVRARYERVDQDNISEEANATTARLRLNYRTGQWNGWSGFAEYDHVFHLMNDFNSGGGTSPDKSQYPVVAYPDGSDLNQLYLDFQANDATKFRLGRHRQVRTMLTHICSMPGLR